MQRITITRVGSCHEDAFLLSYQFSPFVVSVLGFFEGERERERRWLVFASLLHVLLFSALLALFDHLSHNHAHPPSRARIVSLLWDFFFLILFWVIQFLFLVQLLIQLDVRCLFFFFFLNNFCFLTYKPYYYKKQKTHKPYNLLLMILSSFFKNTCTYTG